MRHVRMIGEQFGDRPAQRARAVAVDYAQLALAVQECGVEEFIDQIDGVVGGLADQIEFGCAWEL